MLERIESLANVSVARGCAFAMIAIGTTMVGLSFDRHQCLLTGALLALFTALVLIIKAMRAHRVPYEATELWLLLGRGERPSAAVAQPVIARALRSAYYRFATYFAHGAAGLLILDLAISIIA
ncbi:MAG: hypothetical protein AB7U75_02060 [Hyphomicrobiaceae bacterium]